MINKFTKSGRVNGPIDERTAVRDAVYNAVQRSKTHILAVKQVLAAVEDDLRHSMDTDETGRFVAIPNAGMFEGYIGKISQLKTLQDLSRALGVSDEHTSHIVSNEIDRLFPTPRENK